MALPSGGLHGAYLRSDAVAQLGGYGVRAALARGELRALWPRVVIDAARVADLRTRAAAALLAFGPQSVISGSTAAVLHGCPAIDAMPVHLLVPYRTFVRPRAGLIVHHGDRYLRDIVVVDRLRLLCLQRVICDVLCTTREYDALAVLDQALGLQPPESREQFRAQLSARLTSRLDPRGTRVAGRLLGLATGRAESPPESWLLLLVVDLGWPVPEVNWWLRSPSGVGIYRIDLAWPLLRIALEYDGYAVHAERGREDAAREEELRRRGWIVVRARAEDFRDPSRLIGELRDAFGRRGIG